MACLFRTNPSCTSSCTCYGVPRMSTFSQGRPASLVGGLHVMSRQCSAQRDRRALVEADPHSSGCRRALRGVFEHLPRLIGRDSRKPLHEFGNVCTVFEVLEMGCDWDPSAAKDPGSTEPLRVPLSHGVCRPVNHGRRRTPKRTFSMKSISMESTGFVSPLPDLRNPIRPLPYIRSPPSRRARPTTG